MKTQIWAHRGASAYAPENTLEAFRLAAEMGADGVELDVQLSRDGELVVAHDETIDRVSNGTGYIKDYTLAQLKELSFNRLFPAFKDARIPTLKEVYELLKPGGLTVNVELKTGIILYPEIEEKVLALTASMGMEDRVIYSSFCHPSLVRLKELDSGLKTGLLYSDGWIDAAAYGRHTVGVDALHPALYHMQDPDLIPAARRQGLAVNVWTVNEETHIYSCWCGRKWTLSLLTGRTCAGGSLTGTQTYDRIFDRKQAYMIRLVAIDMDGTLLRPDGHISERNVRALKGLKAMGAEFLICTGRSYIDALEPLQEAGLRAPVVCMNGAAVYDWDGRLMDEIRLSERQVGGILDCCQKEDIIFDFMTDRGSYTTAGEAQFRACFERNVLLPMAEFTYEGVRDRFSFVEEERLFELGLAFYKISVIHESQEVLGRIKERLSGIAELAVASSFATNLELTHSYAQKGRALAFYAASRGVRPEEIMAIGDSENDYSMLSMDIKYTVAMGNAMESIKRTAKCQTRSNIQDGVAYAIETLVLTREARAY